MFPSGGASTSATPARLGAVLLVLSLLATAVPAHASDLGPAADTLYTHVQGCDGSGSPTYWMNAHQNDSDHEQANCGTIGTTYLFGGQTWSFPLDPELDRSLALEDNGTADMDIYLFLNGAAWVNVASTLSQANRTIASGETTVLTVGYGYTQVSLSPDVEEDRLVAGEPITWNITATGQTAALYVGMEEGTWTQTTLPLGPVVEEDFADADRNVSEPDDGGSDGSGTPGSSDQPGEPSSAPSTPGFELLGLVAAIGVALTLRRD